MEGAIIMLKSIYFALHFAMIFLGVVLAIHFDPVIGLLVATTFGVKFFLDLPERNYDR